MSAQVSSTVGPTWRRVLGDPFRLLVSTRLWRGALFFVLSCPLGAIWFCVLLTLIMLGVSTAVIWIELVVLALTMQLWTAGAQVERWRIAAFLSYRLPPSSRPLLC